MQKRLLRFAIPVFAVFIIGYLALRVLFGAAGEVPAAFVGHTSYDDAARRATESERPVLVFATADWCGPCQYLKRTSLADPRVNEVIRSRTEPVYLDLSDVSNADESENFQLAQAIRVQGIPALILIRDGVEIDRRVGVQSAVDLISWLESH